MPTLTHYNHKDPVETHPKCPWSDICVLCLLFNDQSYRKMVKFQGILTVSLRVTVSKVCDYK